MNHIIGFVILHYQAISDTEACIESIKELEMPIGYEIKIVVVDNASPNCTGKILEEKYKNDENIKVVLHSSNAGFSRGNNIGYSILRISYDCEYIFVTNNDVIFMQKDMVKILVSESSYTKYDVIGMDIYNPQIKKHQNPMGDKPSLSQVRRTIWMNKLCLFFFDVIYPLLLHYYKNNSTYVADDYWVCREVEDAVVMGACLIFTKKYIASRDLAFWPETEFYYEEYIIKHWCENNGRHTLYTPKMHVIHNDSASTKFDINRKKRIKRQMKNICKAATIYKSIILDR